MQRRLCEMSEAKWSITEAKCLQMSHNKYASQRDAISPLYGNLMLSHSAGMQHPDISIAGISKRFHFASLHYIFSAYLPTHIKFLTEFHRIFFGTTCISLPNNLIKSPRLRGWQSRTLLCGCQLGVKPTGGIVYFSGSMITSTLLPALRITFFTKAETLAGVRLLTMLL